MTQLNETTETEIKQFITVGKKNHKTKQADGVTFKEVNPLTSLY